VLLNQCPHQLDLLQWICGMPVRVRGICGIGKRHKFEVEDEVTACLEYANGSTGVFVASTGEAPGTNRLEIAGDKGKILVDDEKLRFFRNEVGAAKFCRTLKDMYALPGVWNVEIPVSGHGGRHVAIMCNFVDAILKGAPLIAPAAEGIRSVELANAMLLSSLTDKPVDLALDGRVFERTLKKLIKQSKTTK